MLYSLFARDMVKAALIIGKSKVLVLLFRTSFGVDILSMTKTDPNCLYTCTTLSLTRNTFLPTAEGHHYAYLKSLERNMFSDYSNQFSTQGVCSRSQKGCFIIY